MLIAAGIICATLVAYTLMLIFVVRFTSGLGNRIVTGLGALCSYALYLYLIITLAPNALIICGGIIIITALFTLISAYQYRKATAAQA